MSTLYSYAWPKYKKYNAYFDTINILTVGFINSTLIIVYSSINKVDLVFFFSKNSLFQIFDRMKCHKTEILNSNTVFMFT